jgi:hypothetical protein
MRTSPGLQLIATEHTYAPARRTNAAQATTQTRELLDLSTRATQHPFETAQSAATKSFKFTL